MFTINFLKWKGETNAFPKININEKDESLELLTTVKGSLKEGSSILTPQILVDTSNPELKDGVASFGNYAQIVEFNRYYFIDDVVLTTKNLWRISMRVDVLNTYANSILSQTALILRSENNSTEDSFGVGAFTEDERLPVSNLFFSDIIRGANIFPQLNSDDKKFWCCITFFTTLSRSADPLDTYGRRITTTENYSSVNPYRGVSNTVVFYDSFPLSADGREILDSLSAKIASNSGFASFITSIYQLPFDVELLGSGQSIDNQPFMKQITDQFFIGDVEVISPTPTSFDYKAKDNGIVLKIGDSNGAWLLNPKFTLQSKFDIKVNSFLDLPPYSIYQLHLPLSDSVEVPIEAFIEKTDAVGNSEWETSIYVDTSYDFTVGNVTYKCYYKVYNSVNKRYEEIQFHSVSVPCMNPVAINSSNADFINRSIEAAGLAMLGNAIGSVLKAAGGLAGLAIPANSAGAVRSSKISAVSSLAGGAGDIVSGVGGYVADIITKPLAISGSSNQVSTVFNSFDLKDNKTAYNNNVCLVSYKRKSALPALNDYYSLNGHACHKTLSLSECEGYTEVGQIHLEGVVNERTVFVGGGPETYTVTNAATINEVNEIEQLLKSGVIILKKEGSA